MPAPDSDAARLDAVLEALNGIILGKPVQVHLALTCMLAGGHLLMEDLPGMGKTTMATALAHVFGLDFKRIQFTSDLLPADIVGANVYNREQERFEFLRGPVFTELVLADEINRATPRTQSALLEAMEERRVSVDGQSYALREPFFVIATQNPSSHLGTYPLPESQLDRFLMRLSLGYPDSTAEQRLLAGEDPRKRAEAQPGLVSPAALVAMQKAVSGVEVATPVLEYVVRLLTASRESPAFRFGLSPRAGRGLLAAARAHALLRGRGHVLPDDVQAVLAACVDHRLEPRDPGADRLPSAQLVALVDPL